MNRAFKRQTIFLAVFNVVVSAGFMLFVSTSQALTLCEDLFYPERPLVYASPSSTRTLTGPSVESKFESPLMADQLYEAFNQKAGRDLRVSIETARVREHHAKSVVHFFEHLVKRGLKVDFDAADENRLVLSGAPDVVLTALRHPKVTHVLSISDAGVSGRARWFFSDVAPRTPESTWPERLSAKFDRPEFYSAFRKKFLGEPGLLYEVAVKLNGINTDRDQWKFIHDINKLGITVSASSYGIASELKMAGPIDALFSVIRHPAVDRVVRLEKVLSEKQAQVRVHQTEKVLAKIRYDLSVGLNARRRIVLEGEPPVAHAVLAYRDADVPSLIRLKSNAASQEIPHEVLTAKDYAAFVRHHFDQDFGYIAEFDGRTVPAFDGLVLHQKTHEPIANVSLKYHSVNVGESIEKLRADIQDRFSEHRRRKRHNVTRPEDWFNAINNIPPEIMTTYFDDYDSRIRQTRDLITLFGLFPGSRAPERETRIVLDFRDHGFSFDFVKSAAAIEALQGLARANATQQLTMTLLWNDRQAIELDRTGVKIYE